MGYLGLQTDCTVGKMLSVQGRIKAKPFWYTPPPDISNLQEKNFTGARGVDQALLIDAYGNSQMHTVYSGHGLPILIGSNSSPSIRASKSPCYVA